MEEYIYKPEIVVSIIYPVCDQNPPFSIMTYLKPKLLNLLFLPFNIPQLFPPSLQVPSSKLSFQARTLVTQGTRILTEL